MSATEHRSIISNANERNVARGEAGEKRASNLRNMRNRKRCGTLNIVVVKICIRVFSIRNYVSVAINNELKINFGRVSTERLNEDY